MKRIVKGMAVGLLAVALAGCSGGSKSSKEVGQIADQAQALATQLQVAASVDAVKAQAATLTALGDQLSKLKGQIAGLPAATNLDAQITAVASLVSATRTQLAAELAARQATTTSEKASEKSRPLSLKKELIMPVGEGPRPSSQPNMRRGFSC